MSRRRIAAFLTVVIIAVVVAFSPALSAPFQFDDIASIPRNPTITSVFPLGTSMSPPPGITVSGRPIVNLSLAINHAASRALGADPLATTGYHVVNLGLHIVCGLLLFGLIRRTIRQEPRASYVALAASAIWLIHPIQTEAVDYIIQRTELLVSVCLLATLYASIRAWDARSPKTRFLWYVFGVVACLVGMGSKEVMVGAPLVIVLYDRAFRVASWKALLSNANGRVAFYAALFATSFWLLVLVASGSRAETVGMQLGITWQQYLYSQAWAIGRYVTLLVWPSGLTYDYGYQPISGLKGIPGTIALVIAGIVTIVAWRRQSALWLAFLGTVFLVLLAPSSSIIPIRTEIAAERRIYLASAALILLAVLGAERFLRTRVRGGLGGVTIAALLFCTLGAVTFRRSTLYRDPEALWRDATVRMPENARAYDNLAAAILAKSNARIGEADALLRRAIALDSANLFTWSNLADVDLQLGKDDEAVALLEHVIGVQPDAIDANARLAGVLVKRGAFARAIPMLERVARDVPSDETFTLLAKAYAGVGRAEDARAAERRASEINPSRGDTAGRLGADLLADGRAAEAVPYLERAARDTAAGTLIPSLLVLAYAQSGRAGDAMSLAPAASAKAANDVQAYIVLGRAMLGLQQLADADKFLSEAVRLAPHDAEALTRLGIVEASSGRMKEAGVLFQRALTAQPGYEPALQAVAKLRGAP